MVIYIELYITSYVWLPDVRKTNNAGVCKINSIGEQVQFLSIAELEQHVNVK